MRLRALHLGNVRKFAGKRASITGIGDGITVVSEANEFGKSTFFDALHALFFEKYSSANKPVKSLQPYAKGAVEIAAEIETDAGLFRVEKTFVQRKSARVLRLPSGAVEAQDDEAERWIKTMLGSDRNGPAGLLWVRQGVTGLEVDSKDETLKQLETRRDLLSTVSGEIDAMTGGRRMDRVMKRVAEDLKPLVTATGKPTGAWRTLGQDIAQMEADLQARDAQINKLSDALAGRKQAEAALAQLDVAEAVARRTSDLRAAEEAFAKAQAHAGRVELIAQDHRLAELAAQGARAELDRFLAAIEALSGAQSVADASAQALLAARETTAARAADAKAARRRQEAAQQTLAGARKALDSARKQVAARAALTRSNDLKNQLQQIETVQKTRDEARAVVQSSKATPEWLRHVEEAQNAVVVQAAAVEAQSVSVRVDHAGEGRVSRDGTALPDAQSVVISGMTDLELPGLGRMSIHVPDTGAAAIARLAECETARDELLRLAGAATLADGRTLAAQRARAMQDGMAADTVLKTLAPEGPDPLRREQAAADLIAADATDDDLPARDALEATLDKAEAEEATAQADLAAHTATAASAREAEIRAKAAADTADLALASALAAAGPEEKRDPTRAELVRADAVATEVLSDKAKALETLRAEAPDMATAQAELTRAQATVQAATTQIQTLRERIAALSAEIHAFSDAGIEEARDTLAEQVQDARAREARLAGKAAALMRLQRALETERSAARDTYFGPVQQELAPLLSILYDGADVQFDSDSLLPAGLTRAQTEEQLDRLSGGTQEQIAILTRLAFARLFRDQGRHMPIVLDDALVYSDDARIVKMFTALTRVAQDQQILVFTCRTMAFLSLGGARPEVIIHDF